MNRFAVYAATAATIAAPAAQAAELREWPSWYWGISGGVAYLERSDISGGATGSLEHQSGGFGTLSLGYTPNSSYQPLSNMRFEVELGYHHNSIDDFTPSGGATVTSPAGTRAVSYMANAYYDFRNTTAITPYMGGGAGGSRIKLGRNSGMGNSNDKDNVFAYQFMTGIYYTPPGIPTTQWGLGYRYFVEDSPEFSSPTGKIKLDDLESHHIELGARFRF